MAVTHSGLLSVEQINHIQKDLIVQLRTDTFWDKFCGHTSVPEGTDSVEWRKLNLPEVSSATAADLTEGVTPAGLTLTYVKFKTSCVDYGNYIEYTDKSARYNYDDVVRDAQVRLGQDAREVAEYKKAAAYISGCCTMDPAQADGTKFLNDCLKARTIMKKNHVKPLSGNKYGAIIPSEIASTVLLTYKDAITHTSQKEALIDGYLGELGGFILFESTHPALYNTDNETQKAYALFIGKSEYGLPVETVAFGNDSVQIINHGLGEGVSKNASSAVVADALNQHGTVGYKVMGFATRIVADEAVIRVNYTVTPVSMSVTDSSRTGYQGTASSN